MKARCFIKGLFGIALLLFLFPAISFGETSPFKLQVASLKDRSAAGDMIPVTVTIMISPNHYIYKDQIKVESDDPAQFTVVSTELPPEKIKYDPFLEEEIAIYEGKVVVRSDLQISKDLSAGPHDLKLKVHYQGCSDKVCFAPKVEKFTLPLQVEPYSEEKPVLQTEKQNPPSRPDKANRGFQKIPEGKGLFVSMILVFLAGIGLSFTPCVYPMIPIIVAVIGGKVTSDRPGRPLTAFLLSLVYVLGISVVYATLGVIAASTGALFGFALQSPWVIGFIVAIFIALALSMFGIYTLQVPSFISERLGEKAGKGFVGVFIMGLISGIVASPCIGPVLASLLVYIATTGDKFLGFLKLFVFAWGLGVPLIVLGTFSGAIKAMPKSGVWMVTIERIFGLLLIGVALYYLRLIIPENAFIMILGIFLIVTAVFSGGFDSLTHESTYFQRAKKAFGIVVFIFGIYFLAGHLMMKGYILPALTTTPAVQEIQPLKEEIHWITNEEEGLRLARAENRVAMIDFWAEWCAACMELEKVTYRDPAVIRELQRFVTIKIDCTNVDDPGVKQLLSKYGVVGLPTMVFVNRDGTIAEDKTIIGFVTPNEFLAVLKGFE
jgi:thioredoxin:protein disulfide reductase